MSNTEQHEVKPPRDRNVTGRERRAVQIDLLIGALLQGASVTDAARSANMAVSSAYEVLKDEAVKERLLAARSEALAAASSSAATLAAEAVQVLAGLMRGAASEQVRRQAASDLLAHASALSASSTAEAQVESLEQQVAALSRNWS